MKSNITRRKFMAATGGVAAGLTAFGATPSKVFAQEKTVKIGFLAALTGDAAGWGLPGLYGVEIWAEQLNAAGGLEMGGEKYRVEVISYDDEFDAVKATIGAKKLLFEDEVSIVLMLGITPVQAVKDFMTRNKMLTTTLVPTDISDDAPYLFAPVEVHPFYNVTAVDYIARNMPHIKTAAIATQNDELGLSSLATYRAAFEVAGIEVIEENLFGFEVTDFAPVVSKLIAANPDLITWDTAYPDYVNLLTEQAFLQGYKGQFVNCTLDQYEHILSKTSKEFLEGFLWQFPDLDDPIMQGGGTHFDNAAAFYKTYAERYPGAWTAVSWEYAAALEMWRAAANNAGTFDPPAVADALRSLNPVPHAFGDAEWWGEDFFGVNSAALGKWPVVQMQNGKAVIVEMGDVRAWCDQHLDVLKKHFIELGVPLAG
jgi:branched-chain amino acid transport system substrate-binding protein